MHFVAGFNYSSINLKSVLRFLCAVSRLSGFYSQEYNSGYATIYKSGEDLSNINNNIYIRSSKNFSKFRPDKNREFPFWLDHNDKYDMSELVSQIYFLTGVSKTDISLYRKIERTITGGFIGKYALYEAGRIRQGAYGKTTPVTLSGKFFDGKIARLSTFEETGDVLCDYVISPASYSGSISNIPFDKKRKNEKISPNSFTGIAMKNPIIGSDVPVNDSAVTVIEQD